MSFDLHHRPCCVTRPPPHNLPGGRKIIFCGLIYQTTNKRTQWLPICQSSALYRHIAHALTWYSEVVMPPVPLVVVGGICRMRLLGGWFGFEVAPWLPPACRKQTSLSICVSGNTFGSSDHGWRFLCSYCIIAEYFPMLVVQVAVGATRCGTFVQLLQSLETRISRMKVSCSDCIVAE